MTNVGAPITSLTLIPRINNSPLAAYGGKIWLIIKSFERIYL